MIVIQQSKFQGALPMPSGPASPSSSTVARQQADLDAQRPSRMLQVPSQQPDSLAVRSMGRQRKMTRAVSMFQPSLDGGRPGSSSRSTSPLTSIDSLRSSPGVQTASTQTSISAMPSVRNGGRGKGKNAASQQTIGASTIAGPSTPSKAKSGRTTTNTVADDPAAIAYEIPEITMPPFGRSSTNAQRDLARTWEAVANARRIVVICGAGISVSSPANIPDFRSAQGLFRKLKEKHPNVGLQSGKDLFDANLFNSPATSALFYSMVAELRDMADAAAPTSFHHLLKRLDLEGRLMRVYTQNIDGLEEKAGLTFGLGTTGDSRKTVRTQGKRKREAASGVQPRGMARCKSDSAVLSSLRSTPDNVDQLDAPMFPRAVPLHGALSTMTCQVCGEKIYLTLCSNGPDKVPASLRHLSDDAIRKASDAARNARDLLAQGESVSCSQCEAFEETRVAAGLRSRGVGTMKVDVVLYNGQNEGAERVGDCVERDILGLRDPNETAVPENRRERMLRERKERKEQDKADLAAAEAAAAAQAAWTMLPVIEEAATADDALAAAFADEDDVDARSAEEALGLGLPSMLASSQQAKPKRVPRLKPLPPDLLIVAGTSLKVPGTKRIVREFAKACQARDYREYPSDDEGSDEEASKGSRSRSTSPRTTRAKANKQADDKDDQDEDEDEDDVNAPIRTILLNYDFPVPPAQWEDVFDVWVQGDVQQAALGLWEASCYPIDQSPNAFSMANDEGHALTSEGLSWSSYQDLLEAERKAAKKAAAALKKSNASQQASQASQADATVVSGSQTDKGKSASQAGSQKAKKEAKVPAPKARATETASPLKKKAKPVTAVKPSAMPKPPTKGAGLTKYMKGTKASVAVPKRLAAKAEK